MFDFIKTFFISVVQGVTEWLPVSSTGHMILLEDLLQLDVSEEFFEFFLAVVQLGSALAVGFRYFYKLNVVGKGDKKTQRLLWVKLTFASAPAALLGFIFGDLIKSCFYTPQAVSVALVVYGIVFLFTGVIERKNSKFTDVGSIPLRNSVGIGIFQALSLIPGTSRSGSTIIGGMLLGADRKTATEFSFFMSLPIMLGASALSVAEFGICFSDKEVVILLIGVSVSFLVSLLTLDFLVGFVKRRGFALFGVYRILLGLALLALK